MRKGKKQAARLAARVKSYEKIVASDSSRAAQYTKPGSNKKS